MLHVQGLIDVGGVRWLPAARGCRLHETRREDPAAPPCFALPRDTPCTQDAIRNHQHQQLVWGHFDPPLLINVAQLAEPEALLNYLKETDFSNVGWAASGPSFLFGPGSPMCHSPLSRAGEKRHQDNHGQKQTMGGGGATIRWHSVWRMRSTRLGRGFRVG